jgi:hypothetical protein
VSIRHKGGIGNASVAAAFVGNIEMLQFFKQHNISMDEQSIYDSRYYKWNRDTCNAAASNGNRDTLKFLHENGCPWDHEAIHSACKNNHLDCVIYMINSGLKLHFDVSNPPNQFRLSFATSKNEQTLDGTVSDHENVFYRFESSGTHHFKLSDTYTYIDILKYFNESIGLNNINYNYFELMRFGNMECLKYIVESKLYIIDIESCKTALHNTDIDCIRYIFDNCSCKPNGELFTYAYEKGQLEMIKILIKLNCPFGEKIQGTRIHRKEAVYKEIDEFLATFV